MNLSRRWFLIGGSSFVAAAALPAFMPAALMPRPIVSAAAFGGRFPYRSIFDLTICFLDEGPNLRHDAFSIIDLVRPDGQIAHHFSMHRRSMFRWVAIPGHDINVTEDTGIKLDIQPSPAGAQIYTCSNVQPDRKKMQRLFAESFCWDKNGILCASSPLPLDVRDMDLTPADLLKDDPPRPKPPPIEEMSDEECDALMDDV